MQRRRRVAERRITVDIAENLVLELHPHELSYYSKLESGSCVCDRCHRLCFDEGWRCDKHECIRHVEVDSRMTVAQPFFCVVCFQSALKLQSECVNVVIAEKVRTDANRRSRVPNLRTNWRDDPTLSMAGAGKDSDALGQALLSAVTYGQLERVKEIVDHSDFSRHVQLEDTLQSGEHAGKTPLLLAAEGGHRGIVCLLVERGADREVADIRTGMTPLQVAAYRGHASVVDELVHAGVSIDRLSPSAGYSAMHYAAVNGHAAVLRRLLKFGGDLLVRTPQGRTALVIAACNGHHLAVAELLLHLTLEEVLLPDKEGYTAVDIAIAREHNKVVMMLQEWIVVQKQKA